MHGLESGMKKEKCNPFSDLIIDILVNYKGIIIEYACNRSDVYITMKMKDKNA